MLCILLRLEGAPQNINRIYREEGLGVRKRKDRKRTLGKTHIMASSSPSSRGR